MRHLLPIVFVGVVTVGGLTNIAGCSDNPAVTDAGADAGPDAASSTLSRFAFISPVDGELAEPGDVLDLVVSTTGGQTPTLTVNGTQVSAQWTPDPNDATVLHAPFTVTADATNVLLLVAKGPDGSNTISSSRKISLQTPTEKVNGTTGATETVLTLTSGAKLRIPADALPSGTAVTISSYDPSTIPSFAAATMLSPIYRVHLSADETAIKGTLSIEEPQAKTTIASLSASGLREARADVYEGEDPDPETPPLSIESQLTLNPDGTGLVVAPLPAGAFHHTGSCASIVGIMATKYPFEITTATVTASNDADGTQDSKSLIASTPPTIQLSNSGTNVQAHVSLAATIGWSVNGAPTNPPAWQMPLQASFVIKSPVSALRENPTGTFRQHQGIDLSVPVGTSLYAAADGDATLVMHDQFAINLAVAGGWQARYLHISDVVGFQSDVVAQGTVLGTDLNGNPVKAPGPGNAAYGLSCNQYPAAGNYTYMLCDLTQNGTPIIANGCLNNNFKYCIIDSSGVFKRKGVKAGDQIGLSGQTSAAQSGLGPHLHFEIWYGNYPSGTYLDPSLFYPKISQDPLENGPTPSTLRSPMLRFAAQLDAANEPLLSGRISGTLLGVNATTLASELSQDETTTTTVCPYGTNAAIPVGAYKVTKLGAPGAPTTIAWDLGACIYPSLVDSSGSTPVCSASNSSVMLTFGLTSWRRNSAGQFLFLGAYPPANTAPPLAIVSGVSTGVPATYATVTCCDGASNVANCPGAGNTGSPLVAASYNNLKLTVQGIGGEFATSTMTLTNVTSVTSLSAWQANHPNEAGTLSYSNIPSTATVFTFMDTTQPAGIVGFPATFQSSNPANRYGRSNLIAVWQDVNKVWQWVMNISGGSYVNNGTATWHEYQFIYDSRGTLHNYYAIYLGSSGTGTGFTFVNSYPTTAKITGQPNVLPFYP